jgi:KaiC/GvpD/RAD55 family RecA-like ATPase
MVKLEEATDCVVETQLQELKRGQRRRLRIKKLRGKPYIDKWTSFQIETERGIIFYSRAKP